MQIVLPNKEQYEKGKKTRTIIISSIIILSIIRITYMWIQ